jgi:hypothetical protein
MRNANHFNETNLQLLCRAEIYQLCYIDSRKKSQ